MEKHFNTLGWMAAAVVILTEVILIYWMISDNYEFISLLQIIVFIGNILWVGYGFSKPQKDWPLIVANGFLIVIAFGKFVYSIVGGF